MTTETKMVKRIEQLETDLANETELRKDAEDMIDLMVERAKSAEELCEQLGNAHKLAESICRTSTVTMMDAGHIANMVLELAKTKAIPTPEFGRIRRTLKVIKRWFGGKS